MAFDTRIEPGGQRHAQRYDRRIDLRPGQDVPVVIDGAEVGRIAVANILP
jgi:hypothetical protein